MLWSVLQELQDTGACKGRPRLCVCVLHCFAFSERLLQPTLGETQGEGGREGWRKEGRKKSTNVRHVSCARSKWQTSSRSKFFYYYLLSLKNSVLSTGDCCLLEQLSRKLYVALCLQPSPEWSAVLGLQMCLDFVASQHGLAIWQITVRTDFSLF